MTSRVRPLPKPSLAGLVLLTGLGWASGCGVDQPERLQPALAKDAPRQPTTLLPRSPVPGVGVLTDRVDHAGNPVRARCSSCHATRSANDPARDDASELKDFHNGLTLRHGTLRCGQCHGSPGPYGAPDYDTLRLADGRAVAFDDAIDLCAQCHGPQKRDYDHGSHGGMRGSWDRRLGARERNQCVHCHDPHAPAYVGMVPAPGPRDRFMLHPERGAAGGGH